MHIFGLNNPKGLKYLGEFNFQKESNRLSYFKKLKKTKGKFKYLVVVEMREVYEAEIPSVDYYKWDSEEGDYLFLIDVPENISRIKWEEKRGFD